jgi:hypothetical protein
MGYLKWSVFWLYAKILNQSALPFDPINNLKLFLPGGETSDSINQKPKLWETRKIRIVGYYLLDK